MTNEGDGAAHTKLSVEGLEVAGEAGQGIEQVGHAHQVVIALHGVPVQGKGMLVVVALVFFHQEARLDTPAVARAEVAAFMDVVWCDGAAGNPGMACDLGDGLPVVVHLLPALFADDNMKGEVFTARLGEFVVDGVDPEEALAALAPGALEAVFGL